MKSLPDKRGWRLSGVRFLLVAFALFASWSAGFVCLAGGPWFPPFALLLTGFWIWAFSLRLRDMGRSVWFQVAPMALTVAVLAWGGFTLPTMGLTDSQAYLVLGACLLGIVVIWLVFFGWLVIASSASARQR